MFITGKVTPHFFETLAESICYTGFPRLTPVAVFFVNAWPLIKDVIADDGSPPEDELVKWVGVIASCMICCLINKVAQKCEESKNQFAHQKATRKGGIPMPLNTLSSSPARAAAGLHHSSSPAFSVGTAASGGTEEADLEVSRLTGGR